MIPARLPDNEEARLAAIERYRLGGTGREQAFDRCADLAALTFNVPIGLVSIVGAAQQSFRGATGIEAEGTSRDVSFCSHAIHAGRLFVVEDALEDKRFAGNPLVTGGPHIRFYAGAPLRLDDGTIPGTLCIIDRIPRRFGEDDRRKLALMAQVVVDLIEFRLDGIVDQERNRALSRMKDDFVSATSHELRTPLTSIVGSLALLEQGLPDTLADRPRRLIEIAHANARRLLRLVNDILDIDKLASGNVAFDPAPIEVGEVLHQAAEANAGFAVRRGVALKVASGPPGLVCLADRERLMQVLANLISNAVKFSDEDGTVELAAGRSNGVVRISVSDTGPGIPTDFHDKVFRRFAQARGAPNKAGGGTGLGLAIVREIVTRMGGTVGFETAEGHGTVFHVDLPVHQEIGEDS